QPPSITPLPHSSVQVGLQPSPGVLLPSSHSSNGGVPLVCNAPSPQRAIVQSSRQSSLLLVLPSSHCSPGSTTWSPQRGGWMFWQGALQVGVFGGSHSSTPRCRKLSPQVASRQPSTQSSLLRVLPSSHSSPRPAWTMPSPQKGRAWQVASQVAVFG